MKARSRSEDMILVLFLLCQAADGVLTYCGVLLGLGSEANPILAWIVTQCGLGYGLALAKFISGGMGIMLHVIRVPRILAGLSMFYILVALVPWVLIMFG